MAFSRPCCCELVCTYVLPRRAPGCQVVSWATRVCRPPVRLRCLIRIVRCHPSLPRSLFALARPSALAALTPRSGTALSGCRRCCPRSPGPLVDERGALPPLAPRHRRCFHRLATVSRPCFYSRQPMSSQLFFNPASRSLSTEPYKRPLINLAPRRPAHDGELLERWAPSTLRSRVSPCTAGPLPTSARVSISSCPIWWLWIYRPRVYRTLLCKTINKRSAHHHPTAFQPRRVWRNTFTQLTYLQPLVPEILLCAELLRPGGTTSRPGTRPAKEKRLVGTRALKFPATRATAQGYFRVADKEADRLCGRPVARGKGISGPRLLKPLSAGSAGCLTGPTLASQP